MLPSLLKRFYYRLKGQAIGKHVHFSIGSLLIAKEIKVEEGCFFGFFAIRSVRDYCVILVSCCRVSFINPLKRQKILRFCVRGAAAGAVDNGDFSFAHANECINLCRACKFIRIASWINM
jgi:hypothetical protein